MDASPSNLGLSPFPDYRPRGAPWFTRTSPGRRAASPGNNNLRAEWAQRPRRGSRPEAWIWILFTSQRDPEDRFDPRSPPKSGFTPTEGEQGGPDTRRGLCSKLNTDSGGGVSQGGDMVCVCRPGHEPVQPFDLQWNLLNPTKTCDLLKDRLRPRSTPNLCVRLNHYDDLWPLTWLYRVCSRPQQHNVHMYRPGTLTPLEPRVFKAFIYLVYHQRIWGIWWTISLLHPTVDEEKRIQTNPTEERQRNKQRDIVRSLRASSVLFSLASSLSSLSRRKRYPLPQLIFSCVLLFGCVAVKLSVSSPCGDGVENRSSTVPPRTPQTP